MNGSFVHAEVTPYSLSGMSAPDTLDIHAKLSGTTALSTLRTLGCHTLKVSKWHTLADCTCSWNDCYEI